ncbi:M20 family metallopeptidase [Methylotetracoccus oryzae]|uniref:M20 family metallopeptidase n=1 Tax=Methylotetracoccus oryzae TaxID=1919059 RepID=UPI001118934B|nr:M20 family metallopeptidase [Methylotetracoccus oryzae]
MDAARVTRFVDGIWRDSIVDRLIEYIRIPNKSPLFDRDWEAHGYMDEAVNLAASWCREHLPSDATLEIVRLPGRTPVLFLDIPGTAPDSVLLYGHLDKQPEMTGWRDGLGPWLPVIEGDRLYGRGGADDGYAVFASVAAILALREQSAAYPHCVVLIECCEESGSFDLPDYVEHLCDRIGRPSLVICLDSGCGNYEQLWLTTSLRGLIGGELSVQILTEGVHSGDAGGIVPSSFRIARQLLSRLEDETTGTVARSEFHADIPVQRVTQAQQAAEVLGEQVYAKFPFASGVRPAGTSLVELILNRTWRPALEVTGADGLPPLEQAGNVLRPRTALKLALRLPPIVRAAAASEALKELLECDPPAGAAVRFSPEQAADGWNAPALTERLARSVDAASQQFFGKPALYMGEGGTIPFMGMLGTRFPDAQFLITGVLGPQSNAHGPNEFLHLPTARRVTACVAQVLHDHVAA